MLGRTLGHYRIEAKLGAGGMGEVFLAADTKLGREVAIKVLPPEFARDPQRLARFEREARVLASLNHPHIAAIHGFEQSDGIHFLVLEYVPGETLHGPLPVEETLDVARQIGEALEAAHEKGVVHRDLKPANIKITPEGNVKVLDFGLAKALADEPASDPSQSPTLSAAPTRAGVILGTASYMSPEQARGKPLDTRTDIWSFGCVLYELVTGRQAFNGETVTDIIAAVVGKEPDWTALPASTPAGLERLLRRCLEKDARRRLRAIGDGQILLEEPPTPARRPEGVRRRMLPWALAGTLAVVAAVALGSLWRSATAPQPITRTVVTLPPGDRLAAALQTAMSISPDGSRLVYAASRGGASQLFLRRMDQLEGAPIPGTEGAGEPFFSPDGEQVGFCAGGKLKKVLVSGGAPLALCDAPNCRGASWGPDDTIVFTPSGSSGEGLSLVSANGGAPQALTKPDSKNREHSHRWPQFLPGGKAVLFTVYAGVNPDQGRIAVVRLDTGERLVLFEGASYGRYVPTGHLVYARSGGLLAAPFDPARLQITGRQFPVLEGVANTATGAAQFGFSGSGSLVYVPGRMGILARTLVWVDRKGTAVLATKLQRPFVAPRLSPDGRKLAIHLFAAANTDVWIYEFGRETLTRLTFEAGDEAIPVWTPDGSRVAYRSNSSGAMNLFWKPADGSGAPDRLTTSNNSQNPGAFSPDGRWLAFDESGPSLDIWVLPMEGPEGAPRKPSPFLQTPFAEWGARFSPDGRWLAYSSNESSQFEVYVQPFPVPGPAGAPKWQVSTEGGSEPVWARNGRELFYRNGDKLMAVDVTLRPSFSRGNPRLLFQGDYFALVHLTNYDVSPDGQRFLMLKETGAEAAASQINFVQNWFEDLKRRK